MQNSEHFRTPDDVNPFYGLGQRVSQLTYNSRNLIGNGSTERRDEGISDFGVAIIERMNKAGMAVDVSHCGDRTTLDAFEVESRRCSSRTRTAGRSRRGIRAARPMKPSGVAARQRHGDHGRPHVREDEEPTTIEHVLDHFDHVKKLTSVRAPRRRQRHRPRRLR